MPIYFKEGKRAEINRPKTKPRAMIANKPKIQRTNLCELFRTATSTYKSEDLALQLSILASILDFRSAI